MNLAQYLCCPDCSGALLQDFNCGSCGRVFDTDGSTPCLFTASDALTYSVRYVPLGEVQAALAAALHQPRTAGAQHNVYHLDGAHSPEIEALPKGCTVLEVGCGGGQMRTWVESLGLLYIGTDISKTRVHSQLQLHGGPNFLSDVHNLPVRSESIDLVYSAAVTEHLAAPHRAMQEIFRVLKPGGVYLGNCSFMEPWHDESFFHISPNGAAELLLQAGFHPRAIWPSRGYSGYQSLLRMGNRATRAVWPAGQIMHRYSIAFYWLKRLIMGREKYTEQAYLTDLAISSGATDWIADKPDR